ncbi:trichothecene C-15 hydroxylase [Xylariaceae sp. FL1651]|nr:trichothecene C-15 hydroxylase [Xylariaceae sp. FL1651]
MASLFSGLPVDPSKVVTIFFTSVIAAILGTVFYHLFLHPLKSLPGPLLWRVSRVPWFISAQRGVLPYRILEFHKKYGKIIRIAPDEISVTDPVAWKEFYGYKPGGEFPHHMGHYQPTSLMPINLTSADRKEHGRLRRRLAFGFSDRTMREQEPIIGGYVNLLIRRLEENCKKGGSALNMRDWYSWTTFDIIGDLALGDSFDCLKNSSYHFWVESMQLLARENALVTGLGVSGFRWLNDYIIKFGLLTSRAKLMQYTIEKVKRRVDLGIERPDLIESLIKGKNEDDMGSLSFGEIVSNAGILVGAGAVNNASLLCGVTYYLLMNPETLKKLTAEVRSHFKSQEDITLMSVNTDLPYMLACLNEALRIYPPVAGMFPRQVPKGGATVCGTYLPQNTVVGVYHYAMYHDPNLWKDPDKFAPERFLGDPQYANDQREALEPFSTGPRNCIGKNLAFAEMRLILARIIFAFDMKIAEDSEGWLDQKVYSIWIKPPLNVYLTPVAQ